VIDGQAKILYISCLNNSKRMRSVPSPERPVLAVGEIDLRGGDVAVCPSGCRMAADWFGT
jgi:hypothetical protein